MRGRRLGSSAGSGVRRNYEGVRPLVSKLDNEPIQRAETRSSTTDEGVSAFVTPLASRTPVVPSSIAAATSAPFLTPAPQRIPTCSEISRTAAAVPLTIVGSAVVTEMSPPINSGGSTAT